MLSLGLMQRLNETHVIPALLPGGKVYFPQTLLLLHGISGKWAGRPLCKVKKWFLHLPDNILTSPGVHGKCYRQGCSKGLSPPGKGGTRHGLQHLCLHNMVSSGFGVKECIQESASTFWHCLEPSRESLNIW